jgi:hypothetical protein
MLSGPVTEQVDRRELRLKSYSDDTQNLLVFVLVLLEFL